jgi:hypothetical protein
MPETKRLLERAGGQAPAPDFTLDDVRRRRDRAHRRRRLVAGVVGGGLTLAIVAVSVLTLGPLGGGGTVRGARGGIGLPPATRNPVTVGPNEYTYQHLTYRIGCTTGEDAPDTTCLDVDLDLESWWTWDGSGKIETTTKRNYGLTEGTFGPGEFHTEGDLSAFPLDPDALRTFLLERSAADGASPRPDVTPAPGVPLEDGLLWNAIRDYLGDTQYLNTTPALRAAMLEVLATVPMVRVDVAATDPMGRDAIALRFFAYDEDVVVFVDPATHDFLAMIGSYQGSSAQERVIVDAAGATSSMSDRPTGDDRSVATVP